MLCSLLANFVGEAVVVLRRMDQPFGDLNFHSAALKQTLIIEQFNAPTQLVLQPTGYQHFSMVVG